MVHGAPAHYLQNAAQGIRENRGILNRVRLSWKRHTEPCILSNFFDVTFYAFTHITTLPNI
jgi:hypothetical protein